MLTTPQQHSTIPRRVQNSSGYIWEFHCTSCSFHVQYTQDAGGQHTQLKILNPGQEDARHNSQPPANGNRPLADSMTAGQLADSEAWLTHELRLKLEKILKRLD